MDIHVYIAVWLGLVGLMLGSFAGATVWRIRALQLKQDKAAGERVTAAEKRDVAKLQKKPLLKDRSVCLSCGHELGWYDLIPLFSWISLKGKCRYCKKPIGPLEPLVELGLAVFFVVSYIVWPAGFDTAVDIARFVIWLIAGVGLTILFVYDKKWFLLPDVVTFPLIGLGVINAVLLIVSSAAPLTAVASVAASCFVLSGLYFLIYIASGKKWVGFGDVKLGLALALLLADWQIAILALFLANLIGTIIIMPLLATKKLSRGAHVPFGPLLIGGWAIAGLFGANILDWYMRLMLGV